MSFWEFLQTHYQDRYILYNRARLSLIRHAQVDRLLKKSTFFTAYPYCYCIYLYVSAESAPYSPVTPKSIAMAKFRIDFGRCLAYRRQTMATLHVACLCLYVWMQLSHFWWIWILILELERCGRGRLMLIPQSSERVQRSARQHKYIILISERTP